VNHRYECVTSLRRLNHGHKNDSTGSKVFKIYFGVERTVRGYRVWVAGVISVGVIAMGIGGYVIHPPVQALPLGARVSAVHPIHPSVVHVTAQPMTIGSDTQVKHVGAKVSSVRHNSNSSHSNVIQTNPVYYKNKVVIVTFHDISPNVYSPYVISPTTFVADLNAFRQHHLNVITNQEFINFFNRRGSVPPNAILLTFDDGYRNMYTYALPVLLQDHMQGTFFEIVGTADKHDSRKLSWGQLKAMVRDGMAIESHTYDSHYEVKGPTGQLIPVFNTPIVINGKRETKQQYDTRVYDDFVKARMELSKVTGAPVIELAWPYGYGTPMSTYLAYQAGYRMIFTTADGYVNAGSNPAYIHRIDVGKNGVTPEQAVQRVIYNAEFHWGMRSQRQEPTHKMGGLSGKGVLHHPADNARPARVALKSM